MIALKLCAALLFSATLILADVDEAELVDPWAVYYPDAFHENNHCASLNCLTSEVCLVHGNTALCVKERDLDKIEMSMEERRGRIGKERGDELASAAYTKLDRYKKRVHKMQRSMHDSHLNEVDHLLKVDPLTDRDPSNAATRRHSAPAAADDTCAGDELLAMGERLLKWFDDVRHATGGQLDAGRLPPHHIQCKESVAWMFSQWDGDADGKLTLEELNSLESDKYEHCIKPFIDRCDDNADDKISMDEWCDCFVWVGRQREEPPCHAARHKVDPHVLGAYLPRCDIDGYYRPEQCHENTCWCADRWGREFDRSRAAGKRPDCAQYAEPDEDEEEL